MRCYKHGLLDLNLLISPGAALAVEEHARAAPLPGHARVLIAQLTHHVLVALVLLPRLVVERRLDHLLQYIVLMLFG